MSTTMRQSPEFKAVAEMYKRFLRGFAERYAIALERTRAPPAVVDVNEQTTTDPTGTARPVR